MCFFVFFFYFPYLSLSVFPLWGIYCFFSVTFFLQFKLYWQYFFCNKLNLFLKTEHMLLPHCGIESGDCIAESESRYHGSNQTSRNLLVATMLVATISTTRWLRRAWLRPWLRISICLCMSWVFAHFFCNRSVQCHC